MFFYANPDMRTLSFLFSKPYVNYPLPFLPLSAFLWSAQTPATSPHVFFVPPSKAACLI